MEEVKKYRSRNRRRLIVILIALVIIAIFSIYSASVSTMDMTFMEAYNLIYKKLFDIPLTTHMERIKTIIIFDYNMPRTVGAIAVGVSLAVCGAIMQSITRNPLTDSYTIGISSAALLGVTIAMAQGICVIPGLLGNDAYVVNAFVFALIPSAAIVFVSTFKKMSPTMMILIGIGIMYLFNAMATFLKFNASEETLQQIYEWGVGTLSMVDWDATYTMVAGACLVFAVGMIFANSINVMGAGDSMAKALGVRPIFTRVLCFVVISISTGACVAFTGTIGFVGLVGPHVARLLVGSNNKILIPTSAVIGALLILGADIIVRVLPGGLPVGVITAIIGSPIFLYILYKQKKNTGF